MSRVTHYLCVHCWLSLVDPNLQIQQLLYHNIFEEQVSDVGKFSLQPQQYQKIKDKQGFLIMFCFSLYQLSQDPHQIEMLYERVSDDATMPEKPHKLSLYQWISENMAIKINRQHQTYRRSQFGVIDVDLLSMSDNLVDIYWSQRNQQEPMSEILKEHRGRKAIFGIAYAEKLPDGIGINYNKILKSQKNLTMQFWIDKYRSYLEAIDAISISMKDSVSMTLI